MAIGPSRSAASFCATARISPVEGRITTIIACLPVMSTAFCAASCTDRSRLILTDGAGSPCTSCSTSTSAPFWLTVTTRQPGVPSRSSATVFLISLIKVGAKSSSVGTISGCGVMTTPGSADRAPTTSSWSALRSVIRLSGPLIELDCSARRWASRVLSNRRSTSATTRAVGISAPPACWASSAKW